MRRLEVVGGVDRPFRLSLVFLVAFLVHAPLLLMKLPLKSYDTNFHIFFASHYSQHWFDPWNPKWYAGFSQTTYPPLPQQWLALASRLIGLDMGYMLVQFVAILLLALGVYRFSALWVGRRAASYSALASILLGSESFLVYSAGQLSTTFAAPLYLNALPYIYEWIRFRDWRSLLKGAALATAAAAAHHATLLFGAFLFAVPVLALAILDVREGRGSQAVGFVFRTALVSILVGAMIAVVLLPFWMALIKYPVTQVPIPHPSRANYILSPQWGVNFFLVPYGAMILAFPVVGFVAVLNVAEAGGGRGRPLRPGEPRCAGGGSSVVTRGGGTVPGRPRRTDGQKSRTGGSDESERVVACYRRGLHRTLDPAGAIREPVVAAVHGLRRAQPLPVGLHALVPDDEHPPQSRRPGLMHACRC